MTHEVTLQDRAKQIFKTYLTPYMEERGFKKDGRIYSKQLGRVQHFLDIDQSHYNRRDRIEFGVGAGVYIPDVEQHFWHYPPPKKPKKISAGDGVITCTPGLVAVPKRAQSWILESSDGPEKDAEIGQDIRAVLEAGAFRRFFDRFQTEADVATFLSQPRKKEDWQISPEAESLGCIYAGIIWDQLGECEKCKACMAQAAEWAKGKRVQIHMEQYAREYVCGKLPPI